MGRKAPTPPPYKPGDKVVQPAPLPPPSRVKCKWCDACPIPRQDPPDECISLKGAEE